jgi:hypothetical protein
MRLAAPGGLGNGKNDVLQGYCSEAAAVLQGSSVSTWRCGHHRNTERETIFNRQEHRGGRSSAASLPLKMFRRELHGLTQTRSRSA